MSKSGKKNIVTVPVDPKDVVLSVNTEIKLTGDMLVQAYSKSPSGLSEGLLFSLADAVTSTYNEIDWYAFDFLVRIASATDPLFPGARKPFEHRTKLRDSARNILIRRFVKNNLSNETHLIPSELEMTSKLAAFLNDDQNLPKNKSDNQIVLSFLGRLGVALKVRYKFDDLSVPEYTLICMRAKYWDGVKNTPENLNIFCDYLYKKISEGGHVYISCSFPFGKDPTNNSDDMMNRLRLAASVSRYGYSASANKLLQMMATVSEGRHLG